MKSAAFLYFLGSVARWQEMWLHVTYESFFVYSLHKEMRIMVTQSTNQSKEKSFSKLDEKVLVVPRESLFKDGTVSGFQPTQDFGKYVEIIRENKQFLSRSQVEEDPSFKQIIPYLIFSHQSTYFLMQRKDSASESRLKNKYTLGIGGHIREEDITGCDILGWSAREFDEEVDYLGAYSIIPLGIINDESNTVGQVHTGFAFLLKGNCPNISVRSELKDGRLLPLKNCQKFYESMESWSQFIFDFLTDNQTKF